MERDILVYDENGGAAALSCAEFAASHGAKVTIATPDRALGVELGGTNLGAHMNELYRYGVAIRPDTRLIAAQRSSNRLVAVLSNTYREDEEALEFDQLVGDNATLPNDELFTALKPLSRNLGRVDLVALTKARRQLILVNPEGRFALYRIGDAWAARNIHAGPSTPCGSASIFDRTATEARNGDFGRRWSSCSIRQTRMCRCAGARGNHVRDKPDSG